MLVERATHPEILAALREELSAPRDPAWVRHLNEVDGTNRQHALEAGYAVFDRGMPFRDFQVSDERRATRLGGADRLVLFQPSPQGPFGSPVTALRLPHHWLMEAGPDDMPSALTEETGILTFQLGSRGFRYDRHGLALR